MGADARLSLFKRFAELNARNLLYMQAEILYLEQELKILTAVDKRSSNASEREYAERVLHMMKAGENGGSLQWRKILDIREKLKEYSPKLLDVCGQWNAD